MYDAVKLYVQAINSLSSAGLDFRKGKKKKRENRISEMETGFSSFNLFFVVERRLSGVFIEGTELSFSHGIQCFYGLQW